MSYQVLARKWRPKTFSEVVGQQHVLAALSNGLQQNRLHHAYLFSGTRGVGKTSIARLFAKGLNCIKGVSADPCGECEHCKAIEEGHFIDLIEIDAASRTKVEDTRELLDNVQYKPVQGKYKVYLIDEVHMLSRHSFNALLKTLEEPPEYVKFLLATTDPQKLPVTILSRCMQFHLKALEPQQISHHLAEILEAEKIPYELTALDKLGKAAQGSIRDSLSLTDQAIALSNGNVSVDVVNAMLGLLDDNQPIELLYALQQGNGERLMQVVQAVAEKGADWEQLLIELADLLHQIAMKQLLPNQANDESQISFLAKHIAPEDVQFFYQTILMGRKELALAPNRRVGVEMTLLRALAFHPKLSVSQASASTQNEVSQSAVQKTEKLVDMPVVSQSIKSSYVAQHQQHSSTSDVANNVPTSPALKALQQMGKLKANTHSSQEIEKKNNSVVAPEKPALELPVVDLAAKKPLQAAAKSETIVEKSANYITPKEPQPQRIQPTSSNETTSAVQNQQDFSDNNEATQEDEEYRWTWLNPDLEEQNNIVRPSEIKQAILANRTEELDRKITQLAAERDPWAKLIEQLDLNGSHLTKLFALNTTILEQTENKLVLALDNTHQHLARDNAVKLLAERLSQYFQQTMKLHIELKDTHSELTPFAHQQQIYHQLAQQAQQDLLEDQQLNMLKDSFHAHLDLDSIRPV
ncbi:DNA polymerase III subunit gamma/tau [Pasteurellaceae bacterium 22721_9_1]